MSDLCCHANERCSEKHRAATARVEDYSLSASPIREAASFIKQLPLYQSEEALLYY